MNSQEKNSPVDRVSEAPAEHPTDDPDAAEDTTAATQESSTSTPAERRVETDAAVATVATTTTPAAESNPPPTKSQLKKIRRWERKQEAKERRKQHEKDVRRAKAEAAGRDLEAERRLVEQRTADGSGKRRRIQHFQTERLAHAQSSFQLCVDCAFEEHMTDREVCSLAKQLRYCYSTNRASHKPSILTLTGLNGKTLSLLQNVSGYEEWTTYAFVPTQQPFEQHFAGRLSDVVYLTSDAPTTLTQLDDSKIYVIGGIVDRNRIKGATLKRAKALGVATARLPLDQHLKAMESTRVLLVNHVFEILLKCKERDGDWRKALEAVIPLRKHAEFVGDGNDDEDSASGAIAAPEAATVTEAKDSSS